MADSEHMDVLHESHDVFKREQDEQLVQWMNRLLCQKQEMPFHVKESLCVQFFSMSNALLMFAVGDQTTGPFLLAAVEPFMDGDIIIEGSLGALKVQKLKFPLHVKPLQLLDQCS